MFQIGTCPLKTHIRRFLCPLNIQFSLFSEEIFSGARYFVSCSQSCPETGPVLSPSGTGTDNGPQILLLLHLDHANGVFLPCFSK